jgi:hypothetical protein
MDRMLDERRLVHGRCAEYVAGRCWLLSSSSLSFKPSTSAVASFFSVALNT